MTNVSLTQALAMGWSIIPINADKKPCVKWKALQQRQPTAEEIERWLRMNPPYWALVTGEFSNVITFDFDGAAGLVLAKQWNIDPHRKSMSGGLHWDTLHPGWRVRTINGQISRELARRWPGLDIKGDGGYALFTGQTAKGSYTWLRPPGPDPIELVPPEVWAFLKPKPKPVIVEPTIMHTEKIIPPSNPTNGRVSEEILIKQALGNCAAIGRNVAGFGLACQLRDSGRSKSEGVGPMCSYQSRTGSTNTKGQIEPYTIDDAMKSLDQAYSQAPREPWSAATSTRPEYRAAQPAEAPGSNAPFSSPLIVIRGDEVAEKPLTWTWKPYLPKGKLVHFGGQSSQAKSPVTVDLSARMSTGADWPDGTPNELGPRSVIMLNIEDDFEDTILPRFRLAGGDKSKLYYIKGTKVRKDGASFLERSVTLESDMHEIARWAEHLPDLGLIIVDPITNYLGSKKMIVEEDVRALLTPLAILAAQREIVAITVGHLNRREKGTDPLHRMMGAAAFVGVARAVYAFGPDPEEQSKYCHVMTVVRSCGGEGPALRYRTELITDQCPDSFTTEIVKVVWTGESNATAEDAVDSASAADKGREQEAAGILKTLLRDGHKPATDCTAILKTEGYDLDNNKLNAFRIRNKAGADSKKFPGDKFYSWYLKDFSKVN